jgi:nanoRNase/pAp phosphatase (c-di-AMP/oligoRNAs hydrolase)
MSHQNSKKRTLVVAHKYADPDALASAVVLGKLKASQGFSVDYYFPQGLNAQARRVWKRLIPELRFFSKVSELQNSYHNLVIVDTSNPSQIPGFDKLLNDPRYPESVEIYDHHRISPDLRRNLEDFFKARKLELHIFETPSLSEAVYEFAKDKINIDGKLASLLLAGILTDTKFLQLANPRTFAIVRELESIAELKIAELRKLLLENLRDISRRIALIKAFKRARFFRFDEDLILAITHSSSFESDIASALVKLCADLAVVVAYKKHEKLLRIALRSYQGVPESFSAYHAAGLLASKLGGSWGGHRHAAVLELRLREAGSKKLIVEKYLNKVLEILTHGLGTHSGAHKEITI